MKKSISLLAVMPFLGVVSANAQSAKMVNLTGVPALITATYIWAIIFALGFLLIAIVISNLIKFEGGTNPKDPGKRRLWFWVLAILAPIAFFLYNVLLVSPTLTKGPAADKFAMHPPIASAVVLITYLILGFVLAKIMSRGKLGNWFPSKK